MLPDVGSTIVPPGLSSPARSASSTILAAMRSFELAPGFKYSSFTATAAAPSGTTEFNRTSGVFPMSSVTWAAMRIVPIISQTPPPPAS
ncbi:hypothetical protein HMPREF9336_04212 [Segniliparus rugosus ATCC BAA-974]|uniref:Uncharacterized protein n=1 Tax=Segniliparus rugosus (strain ATCC BAA-974 / DSM 45345 / CCUG 50838 / CIP 108380 / JCM 13579 / CDC 945) TaxID=679197 RepID=U1LMZ7_SEGRC|nr:hypothetical protein HMPREF9336_04212 [Segniliparus rugosus ATCC BAA-974]